MNEPDQLGHELCLMSSSEEQVNLCFGEVYKRVIWDEVLDNWYKKVLEMPVNLNPETLAIFRELSIPKILRTKIGSGNGWLSLLVLNFEWDVLEICCILSYDVGVLKSYFRFYWHNEILCMIVDLEINKFSSEVNVDKEGLIFYY